MKMKKDRFDFPGVISPNDCKAFVEKMQTRILAANIKGDVK